MPGGEGQAGSSVNGVREVGGNGRRSGWRIAEEVDGAERPLLGLAVDEARRDGVPGGGTRAKRQD
jgi:hypothetical protein